MLIAEDTATATATATGGDDSDCGTPIATEVGPRRGLVFARTRQQNRADPVPCWPEPARDVPFGVCVRRGDTQRLIKARTRVAVSQFPVQTLDKDVAPLCARPQGDNSTPVTAMEVSANAVPVDAVEAAGTEAPQATVVAAPAKKWAPTVSKSAGVVSAR